MAILVRLNHEYFFSLNPFCYFLMPKKQRAQVLGGKIVSNALACFTNLHAEIVNQMLRTRPHAIAILKLPSTPL